MITKRLKNNTLTDKFIITRIIAPGEYYDVPYIYWVQILDNEDIIADVVSGDIVVNDGTTDLNAIDGQLLLERFQFDDAGNIIFNPGNTGIVAVNVADALIEIYENNNSQDEERLISIRYDNNNNIIEACLLVDETVSFLKKRSC